MQKPCNRNAKRKLFHPPYAFIHIHVMPFNPSRVNVDKMQPKFTHTDSYTPAREKTNTKSAKLESKSSNLIPKSATSMMMTMWSRAVRLGIALTFWAFLMFRMRAVRVMPRPVSCFAVRTDQLVSSLGEEWGYIQGNLKPNMKQARDKLLNQHALSSDSERSSCLESWWAWWLWCSPSLWARSFSCSECLWWLWCSEGCIVFEVSSIFEYLWWWLSCSLEWLPASSSRFEWWWLWWCWWSPILMWSSALVCSFSCSFFALSFWATGWDWCSFWRLLCMVLYSWNYCWYCCWCSSGRGSSSTGTQ